MAGVPPSCGTRTGAVATVDITSSSLVVAGRLARPWPNTYRDGVRA
ncbi:hypothetical protein GCM10023169_09560 [Georgenia halophila]|uniref:Uncharacterized protein n=1 Tax=Georgenia halophila TaxID=620889 RepID=A0ABP8L0F2_9MICO